METLISAHNLAKSYGKTQALVDISFSINPGEIVGLIGPNGAGKSTLLKAVLGLLHYHGELDVLGQSPRKNRAGLLEALSYIADVASLPDWISINQLMEFMVGVHPNFSADKALMQLAKTTVTRQHKVKSLSKGMKTQLHLALIMGIDSRLLVLDEPTLGLDILFRTEFYDTLTEDFFNPQRAILVTTHQVEEIEDRLTRVLFIHEGRLSFDMTKKRIAQRFVRLTVDQSNLDAANHFQPIYSKKSGPQHILIFENANTADLQPLGLVSVPGLAELFVAIVREKDNA